MVPEGPGGDKLAPKLLVMASDTVGEMVPANLLTVGGASVSEESAEGEIAVVAVGSGEKESADDAEKAVVVLAVSVATPLPEKTDADGDGVVPSLGEGVCVAVPETPMLLLPISGVLVPAPLLVPQRLALLNGDCVRHALRGPLRDPLAQQLALPGP